MCGFSWQLQLLPPQPPCAHMVRLSHKDLSFPGCLCYLASSISVCVTSLLPSVSSPLMRWLEPEKALAASSHRGSEQLDAVTYQQQLPLNDSHSGLSTGCTPQETFKVGINISILQTGETEA